MYCKNCKTFNSDGRETCANCGKVLLDIHSIMATDRWVGAVFKVLAWGCAAGAVAGTILGVAIGMWLSGHDAIAGALGGGIAGLELGIPAGGIIGGAIGVLKHAPRR